MDIDQASPVAADELFAQDAHEAGQYDQLRIETVDTLAQSAIE
jgi:hypothetical protein